MEEITSLALFKSFLVGNHKHQLDQARQHMAKPDCPPISATDYAKVLELGLKLDIFELLFSHQTKVRASEKPLIFRFEPHTTLVSDQRLPGHEVGDVVVLSTDKILAPDDSGAYLVQMATNANCSGNLVLAVCIEQGEGTRFRVSKGVSEIMQAR